MKEKLFEGLKVVEVATVLAGPSVGMFFAELGAKVTKIENPNNGGDVTRNWRLKSEDGPLSAYYCSINMGKEVLFKDLSHSDGINAVYRLVTEADLFICNFKRGDALKFGMDYSRLREINPKLIYGQITGFSSSPSRVAYDVVIQAETGWMSINGEQNSAPLKMPVALMDVLAAHQLKEGILAALWKREKTGKGSKVTCSLEQAGIASLVNQAANYIHAGHIPQQMGSLHPNIAPYGDVFFCHNNLPVVLAIGSDKQFILLNHILGATLHEDERFSNNPARVANRPALQHELGSFFLSQRREDLLEKCISANVPIGAVKRMDEVFENPAAQKMVWKQENMTAVRSVAFSISS